MAAVGCSINKLPSSPTKHPTIPALQEEIPCAWIRGCEQSPHWVSQPPQTLEARERICGSRFSHSCFSDIQGQRQTLKFLVRKDQDAVPKLEQVKVGIFACHHGKKGFVRQYHNQTRVACNVHIFHACNDKSPCERRHTAGAFMFTQPRTCHDFWTIV